MTSAGRGLRCLTAWCKGSRRRKSFTVTPSLWASRRASTTSAELLAAAKCSGSLPPHFTCPLHSVLYSVSSSCALAPSS